MTDFDNAVKDLSHEPVELEWRGLHLVAAPPNKWLLPFQYWMKQGDFVRSLECMFDDGQLATIMESGHTDLEDITDLIKTVSGAGDASGEAQPPG